MPDYLFNLEALPPGEYKATISILKDGRKEIAVVTKTQPDAKIPLIQVPFVISHRPLYELPPHGDLIEREPLLLEFNERADKEGWAYLDNEDIENAPIVITASEEAPSISHRKKTADVGEWVEHFGDVRCSACGAIVDSEIFYMFDPYQLPDFCPLCGAQMMWEGSNEND